MDKLILPIVAIVVLVSAASFLSVSKDAPAESAAPSPVVQGSAADALNEAEARVIEVRGGSFYFEPAEIRVKKGDTVTLDLINDGGFHDFTMDAFGVKAKFGKEGETVRVTFVADKAGSFEYYCGVGRHHELGQKGILIVEE